MFDVERSMFDVGCWTLASDEAASRAHGKSFVEAPEKVTIMGLGLFGGGLGAAQYFLRKGCTVTITDLKTEEELRPSLEKLAGLRFDLHLGGHVESDFTGADLVVVNPAIPRTSEYLDLARRHGARLATEITLFFERCRAPIIGVTGSNGKTTTTSMIGKMLGGDDRTVHVGGNIGRSLLPEVEDIAPDDVVVLELSSFQLEWLGEAGMSPTVAVVTNINPNHLDRHQTMDDYIAAKKNIVAHQKPGSTAVLNGDDKELRRWKDHIRASCHWASATASPPTGSFVRDRKIIVRQGDNEAEVLPVSALPLKGVHNLQNALCAAAACAAVGAGAAAMAKGLAEFQGIEHRLEFVCKRNGVRYYNDSKATTPEAAMAALDSFDSPVILIAGGRDKGMPFDALAQRIFHKTRAAILIGETADTIAGLLDVHSANAFAWMRAGTLEEAVAQAASIASPGDVVLLSPACASYDMFANYEERGNRFKELVRKE